MTCELVEHADGTRLLNCVLNAFVAFFDIIVEATTASFAMPVVVATSYAADTALIAMENVFVHVVFVKDTFLAEISSKGLFTISTSL